MTRVLTMDAHNLSAFQNAFRIPTDNLEAKNLLADYLCGCDSGRHAGGEPQPVEDRVDQPLCDLPWDDGGLSVLAPDSGGMGRARRFRNALETRLQTKNAIGVAYLDKERVDGDTVRGTSVVGDVAGKRVIVLDDMISSGGTVRLCADAVERHGGEVFAVCATHGLFVGKAAENLAGIPRVVITDTIRPFRLDGTPVAGNLHVIPTAKMFGSALAADARGGRVDLGFVGVVRAAGPRAPTVRERAVRTSRTGSIRGSARTSPAARRSGAPIFRGASARSLTVGARGAAPRLWASVRSASTDVSVTVSSGSTPAGRPAAGRSLPAGPPPSEMTTKSARRLLGKTFGLPFRAARSRSATKPERPDLPAAVVAGVLREAARFRPSREFLTAVGLREDTPDLTFDPRCPRPAA